MTIHLADHLRKINSKQVFILCVFFVVEHLKHFERSQLNTLLQRKRKHKLESIVALTFGVYFVNIQK